MSDSKTYSRRHVLLSGGLASAAALFYRSAAAAPAGQRLSPEDPQAQALGYVHDASTVDPATWPKIEDPAGQRCSNCALWQGGDADWGGCGIFPGKQVAAAGWCNAWVPKG